MAFSPDGKNLAITNATVSLWDPESGAQLASYNTSQRSTCVKFAPNGNALVAGRADGKIDLREAIPVAAKEN